MNKCKFHLNYEPTPASVNRMCACYRGYLGNVIKEDKSCFFGACETADVLSLSWKLNNLSWKHPSCGQDVWRGGTRLGGGGFTVLLELGRRLARCFSFFFFLQQALKKSADHRCVQGEVV